MPVIHEDIPSIRYRLSPRVTRTPLATSTSKSGEAWGGASGCQTRAEPRAMS